MKHEHFRPIGPHRYSLQTTVLVDIAQGKWSEPCAISIQLVRSFEVDLRNLDESVAALVIDGPPMVPEWRGASGPDEEIKAGRGVVKLGPARLLYVLPKEQK